MKQQSVEKLNEATSCIRSAVNGIQSGQVVEQHRLGESSTVEDYAILKINDARRHLAEAARELRKSQQSTARNTESVSD